MERFLPFLRWCLLTPPPRNCCVVQIWAKHKQSEEEEEFNNLLLGITCDSLPPSLIPGRKNEFCMLSSPIQLAKTLCVLGFVLFLSKSLLSEWRALLLLRKISSSIAGILPWHHPLTVSRLWLLLFSSCCCCCCSPPPPFLVLFLSSLCWSDIFAGSWWKMRYLVLQVRSVLLWAMLVGWFGSFLFTLRLAACEPCSGFCVLCAFWGGSWRDVLLCRVVKISSFRGSFLGSCLHRSVHNARTFVAFFPPPPEELGSELGGFYSVGGERDRWGWGGKRASALYSSRGVLEKITAAAIRSQSKHSELGEVFRYGSSFAVRGFIECASRASCGHYRPQWQWQIHAVAMCEQTMGTSSRLCVSGWGGCHQDECADHQATHWDVVSNSNSLWR